MDQQELEQKAQLIKIENDDKKEDQIRSMAWCALFGMLFYPLAIVVAEYLGLTKSPDLLSDIAPTYFVSVSALLAAFFGIEAYKNKAKG